MRIGARRTAPEPVTVSGEPESLGASPLTVAGSGAVRLAPILTRLAVAHQLVESPNLGRAAALIAWERRSAAIDPADLEPLYLRPTQAEERLSNAARAQARD